MKYSNLKKNITSQCSNVFSLASLAGKLVKNLFWKLCGIIQQQTFLGIKLRFYLISLFFLPFCWIGINCISIFFQYLFDVVLFFSLVKLYNYDSLYLTFFNSYIVTYIINKSNQILWLVGVDLNTNYFFNVGKVGISQFSSSILVDLAEDEQNLKILFLKELLWNNLTPDDYALIMECTDAEKGLLLVKRFQVIFQKHMIITTVMDELILKTFLNTSVQFIIDNHILYNLYDDESGFEQMEELLTRSLRVASITISEVLKHPNIEDSHYKILSNLSIKSLHNRVL